MRFIKLWEWYYHNGGYLTKPLMCNIDDISCIAEDTSGHVDGTDVTMKNGKFHIVKETYQEIVDMITEVDR